MTVTAAITPFVENDRPVVLDSWLRSYSKARAVESLREAQYFYLQRLACEDLISRCTTLCARPAEWPDGVIGWVCGEARDDNPGRPELVVHYAFVKRAYRRMGVMNELVDALGLHLGQMGPGAFTHERRPYGAMFRKRGWRFEPRYLKGKR